MGWGKVEEILEITQGRARPKLTGLWQVSRSKRMGLTCGNTEGAGRPGPRDVPQTSSTSQGALGWSLCLQAPWSAPWNKGSLWLSTRQVGAGPGLLKRFKDRCIHPSGSETSFSHRERVEMYLRGFPTADATFHQQEPQGTQSPSKGK